MAPLPRVTFSLWYRSPVLCDLLPVAIIPRLFFMTFISIAPISHYPPPLFNCEENRVEVFRLGGGALVEGRPWSPSSHLLKSFIQLKAIRTNYLAHNDCLNQSTELQTWQQFLDLLVLTSFCLGEFLARSSAECTFVSRGWLPVPVKCAWLALTSKFSRIITLHPKWVKHVPYVLSRNSWNAHHELRKLDYNICILHLFITITYLKNVWVVLVCMVTASLQEWEAF